MMEGRPILTNAAGAPFERPTLPPNATSEQRAAYVRARNAYFDAVTDSANAAFAAAFRKVLRCHR